MTNTLRNKVAIVGVGETAVGLVPGKSAHQLQIEAIKLALDDAGLKMDDVDGLCTMVLRDYEELALEQNAPVLGQYLGMHRGLAWSLPWGYTTGGMMFLKAAAAIAAGLANTVVIASAGNRLSSRGRDGTLAGHVTASNISNTQFERPYGFVVSGAYAMGARRHMYEYGTTSEQLASVAVTFRDHATRHPKAQMRKPITVQDVLDSPMISAPLHRLDCCLVSDGGFAFVMTTAERARDLKQKPIYLLGAAEAHSHGQVTYSPSLTSFGGVEAGKKAFAMAGVEHKDIDVLGVYDSFTCALIIYLEDLGFCKKGEGGPFVQAGNIRYDGKYPTNTHGGLLSYAAPGRQGCLTHIVENVLQLRGQAEGRQVKDAKVGLVHTAGGHYAAHAVLILSNQTN